MNIIKTKNTRFSHICQSIPMDANGYLRISKVIYQFFKGEYSHKKIDEWLKHGHISLNNTVIHKRIVLIKQGDILSISVPPIERPSMAKSALDVLYEDEHIMILNKPKNLVSHYGIKNEFNTIVDILGDYNVSLKPLNRSGLINRLDKDTTGIMVVGKNNAAILHLQKQFQDNIAKRTYLALVHYPLAKQAGRIETYLQSCKKTMSIKVAASGYLAVTYYQVLKLFKHYSLIKCMLETGRTHQIRVHFRHLKHYIVGDKKYTHLKINTIDRQALHSYMIDITHPETHEKMQFICELPQDFKTVLQILEEDNNAILY